MTDTRRVRTPIRSRSTATCFAIGIGAAVMAPMANLWREKPRDSFPLSHYPMFSARRGTHLEIVYLRGELRGGGHVVLDSRLAARGGMNQERKQIARAVKRGRGQWVAEKVSEKLARRDSHPDVIAVEVVVGQYRLERYFDHEPMLPDRAAVVGRQPVPGRGDGLKSTEAPEAAAPNQTAAS